MKRAIAILLFLGACDDKTDEIRQQSHASTCLDYATALLGECFDAVRTAERSDLQCDSGLLERTRVRSLAIVVAVALIAWAAVCHATC